MRPSCGSAAASTRSSPNPNAGMRPAMKPETLERGARLAVTGPSGAGKTTLLMAMAENRSEAAVFAEDAHLFATTVCDNLLVARGDATDGSHLPSELLTPDALFPAERTVVVATHLHVEVVCPVLKL